MSKSIRIAVALVLAIAFVLTMSVIAFGNTGGRNGGEGKPIYTHAVPGTDKIKDLSSHIGRSDRHRAGDDQYDRDDDGDHDRDDSGDRGDD